MTLAPGGRLGPYTDLALLGAGGMGEVYRATDTRLGREVALKRLPESFAADAERLERFRREARLLAALNHPGIAAIHGIEEEPGGRPYLALELVPGEDLAERLKRGPLPLEEALELAGQIASALEAAHEKGIVHRDLKPANVRITPEGRAKLLDFGLARALEGNAPEPDAAGLSRSPTLAHGGTSAGVILGTAAYMSPEQARGRPVDRRTDAWAFGVVLYEMLTGERLFEGETVSDVLASVLKNEPDLERLPDATPAGVRRLLRRCLQKDPARRLRDLGDAGLELAEAAGEPAEETADARRPLAAPRGSSPLLRVLVGVAAVAVVAIAVLDRREAPGAGTRGVRRFHISVGPDQRAQTGQSAAAVQLSPDGRGLLAVTGEARRRQLVYRRLDEPTGRTLDATEGAEDAFFSPDGRWAGFFQAGRLRRVSLTGGAPETVSEATTARGGVWCEDGSIVFTPTTDAPLHRVSAEGGEVQVISRLDTGAGERSHRWPDAIPGRPAILFTVAYETGNPLDHASVAILDLETGEHRVLIEGGGFARYAPTGHVVYARRGELVGAPFDPETLEVTGPPVALEGGVRMKTEDGSAQFSFSRRGDLVYTTGGLADRPLAPLTAVDRDGVERVVIAEEHRYSTPRFSADGSSLFVELGDPAASVWRYDVARGILSRVVGEGVAYSPLPSPDGEHLAYETVRDGEAGLMLARFDGSGERRLTTTQRAHEPTGWSADGRTLLLTAGAESGYLEVWAVSPFDGRGARPGELPPARPVLSGTHNVGGACLSPDDRWIAYVSDESGGEQIYLRAWPGLDRVVRVSADGGSEPAWSRSGRELFYRQGDRLMAVEVEGGPPLRVGRPRAILTRPNPPSPSGGLYDLSADYDVLPGDRGFVMPARENDDADAGIVLALDWFDELRQRVERGSPPE